MNKRNLQDFSIIHQFVERAKADNGFPPDGHSFGFYFVLLSTFFELTDNEIDDVITDDHYRVTRGATPGKDRGIDAVLIDERLATPVVHFFNCKYTADFAKTESFFPSNEVDKILSFIGQLMSQDLNLLKDVNFALAAKIKEIWDHIGKTNLRFVLHICSNLTNGLTLEEDRRLTHALKVYSDFSFETATQSSIAAKLTKRGRVLVHGKCKAIHKNLFEKSAGDIRALIVHVEAAQLLRLLCDDPSLRENPNADMTAVRQVSICESAFEDNVRVYLSQRSKVNRNIKDTVLSPENVRFFYFNNGITITCDRFRYPTNQSAPIIELENVQVVNGGQTIHALYEAFQHNAASIEPVELLCRIYETTDIALSSLIAERTNSQTPVKTRDIQSIDVVQIKLERQFSAMGLYYERKSKQYAEKPKNQRVDAERCGQAALAFYHAMPLEAKNKKQLIFAEKYEDIFSDTTTADSLLLPLRILERIEAEKVKAIKGQNLWLRYATYHILYALRLLADSKQISLTLTNLETIWKLYPKAKSLVRDARNKVKERNSKEFEDVLFFKSAAAKATLLSKFNSISKMKAL